MFVSAHVYRRTFIRCSQEQHIKLDPFSQLHDVFRFVQAPSDLAPQSGAVPLPGPSGGPFDPPAASEGADELYEVAKTGKVIVNYLDFVCLQSISQKYEL